MHVVQVDQHCGSPLEHVVRQELGRKGILQVLHIDIDHAHKYYV